MGGRNRKQEVEKSGICINPACGAKLFESRQRYCSQECYSAYPLLDALLEKEHGKPLQEIVKDALDIHNTEYQAAKSLGVSKTQIYLWKKRFGFEIDSDRMLIVHRLEKKHGKPIRQIIVETLNSFQTKQEAAKHIGIQPNTLLRWIKQHDIQEVRYFE